MLKISQISIKYQKQDIPNLKEALLGFPDLGNVNKVG